MKTKYKLMIVLAIVIVLVVAVWGYVVLYQLNMKQINENQAYICQCIMDDLHADKRFVEEFGEARTVTLDFDKNEKRREDEKWVIACFVEMSDGQCYSLWVRYLGNDDYEVLFDEILLIF